MLVLEMVAIWRSFIFCHQSEQFGIFLDDNCLTIVFVKKVKVLQCFFFCLYDIYDISVLFIFCVVNGNKMEKETEMEVQCQFDSYSISATAKER